MDSKKILSEIWKPIFKKYGFLKKWTSWYLINPEVIGVFNIQKSQWSNLCYINVALYIRENEPMDYMPNYATCHFNHRIGSHLSKEDNAKIQDILSFEKELSQEDEDFLKNIVEWFIQIFFLKNNTKTNILSIMDREKENYIWNVIQFEWRERLLSK